MKTALQTLALIAALGMTTLAAWSQQTPPPAPPASKQISPVERELAITKIKLAIANANLASNNAKAAQDASQQEVVKAQQLIEQTRIELGLDETYAWDFQKQDYVKKFVPTVIPPPAQSAPPKK